MSLWKTIILMAVVFTTPKYEANIVSNQESEPNANANADADDVCFWNGYVYTEGCGTPNSIGGLIFEDFEYNSRKDVLESGIALVNVHAYDSEGLVQSVKTDSKGYYKFTGLSESKIYRIEIDIPFGLQPSDQGKFSGTSVQFARVNSCDVSLGLFDPLHYCNNTNAEFLISCYTNGVYSDSSNVGNSGLVRFGYDEDGIVPIMSYKNEVEIQKIGSTWGAAYNPNEDEIYMATVLKRHTSVGPNGLGAIYRHELEWPSDSAQLLYDFGEKVGTIAPDNVRFPGTNTGSGEGPCGTCDNVDPTTFGQVGKVGIGDIAISADFRHLYAVNLLDRNIYNVSIYNTTSEAEALPTPPWISDPICSNGVGRPWALKIRRGKLYVGVICDASESSCLLGSKCDDLKAVMYSFDLETKKWKSELEFNLDYYREVFKRGSNYFQKWMDNYEDMLSRIDGITDGQLAQPIFLDIEFDDDGSLIIGIGDRTAMQMGYRSPAPNQNSNGIAEQLLSFGDILRASYNPITEEYTLEEEGKVGSLETSNEFENSGIGGQSFYWGDFWFAEHSNSGLGSVAMLPGSGEIMYTMVDIFRTYSNGVAWFDNKKGYRRRGMEIYNGFSSPGTFSKGSGVGEIELICPAAPLEIGNQIWWDQDVDGIMDPDESGICNVTVELYKDIDGNTFGNNITNGDEVLVATTTTDNFGRYIFSRREHENNLEPEIWEEGHDKLSFNTVYIVKVKNYNLDDGIVCHFNANTYLNIGLTPTQNQGDEGFKRDNNAFQDGACAIASVKTDYSGSNIHHVDFGFADIPPCNGLKATAVIHGVTECGKVNGAIDLTVTGGLGEITYDWDIDGFEDVDDDSEDLTGLNIGTYEVIVTDSTGCGVVFSYTVHHDDLAIINKIKTKNSDIKYGSPVAFNLEIHNQGSLPVDSFVVVDYIPCGFEFINKTEKGDVNEGWELLNDSLAQYSWSDGVLNTNSTVNLCIQLTLLQKDSIRINDYVNVAEISSGRDTLGELLEDCDSPLNNMKDDNVGGVPLTPADDHINGDGSAEGPDGVDSTDQDNVDPELVCFFDLALDNRLLENKPLYDPGDTVDFEICLYNQGVVDADSVEITYFIPKGYDYCKENNTKGWKFLEDKSIASLIVNHSSFDKGALKPAEKHCVQISLKVKGGNLEQKDFITFAEISCAQTVKDVKEVKDGKTSIKRIRKNVKSDVDGTFDSDHKNDSGGCFNTNSDDELNGIGNGDSENCEAKSDEDDHDPASIIPKKYSLGNLIWFDANNSGFYDNDEKGIEGVKLDLLYFNPKLSKFEIIDRDTSDENGLYIFQNLLAGEYIVQIPKENFVSGAVLENYLSSTGGGLENLNTGKFENVGEPINANNDIDNDDNGNHKLISIKNNSFLSSITKSITIKPHNVISEPIILKGSEPENELPYNDTTVIDKRNNLTVDFAFILERFDLALNKIVVNSKKKYIDGDLVEFKIYIYNQGNIHTTNVEITDYLPKAVINASTLSQNEHWTFSGDSLAHTLLTDTISGGSFDSVSIFGIFKNSDTFSDYVNCAEISAAEDLSKTKTSGGALVDYDSTPDRIKGNDSGGKVLSAADDYILGNGKGQKGDGVASTDEDDSDPAIIGNVDIALKKTVVSGRHSSIGDTALFEIMVYNQGNFPLKDIKVVDYIPKALKLIPTTAEVWTLINDSLAQHIITNKLLANDSIKVNIAFEISQSPTIKNSTNYAEIAQFFLENGTDATSSDIDSRGDTIPNNDPGGLKYSPSDDAIQGNGLTGGGKPGDANAETDEDDHDPACILFYDLESSKKLVGQKVPVLPGDTLHYEISVVNEGSADAYNVKVKDLIPSGLEFLSSNTPLWTLDTAGNALTNVTKLIVGEKIDIPISFIVKEGASLKTLLNCSELVCFEDGNGQKVDDVDGEEDKEDGKVSPPVFDLALLKIVEKPLNLVSTGDFVTYRIDIHNQGNIDARSIEIGDLPQEGLTFVTSKNPDWKELKTHFVYRGNLNVKAGEVGSVRIVLQVNESAHNSNLNNQAEIQGARDGAGVDMTFLDVDSTPDDDFTNDIGGVPGSNTDNVVDGIGLIDEDDHDPARVSECGDIACKGRINVTLGDECNVRVTPEMLLVDTFPFRQNNFNITYFDLNGNEIEEAMINDVVKVKIQLDSCREAICWVDVLIEDKLPPVIMCKPMDTLNCFEMMMYEGPQTNEECNEVKIDTVFSNYVELCENDSIIGKHTRSYRATDQSGNVSKICTEEIYIKAVSIADIEFPKDTTLSCEVLGDKGLEVIKGINVGHALYTGSGSNLLPVPFVVNETNLSKICNISVTFKDRVILDVACKKQILRTYTARQWTCSGHESKREFPQLITVSDTIPPMVSVGDTVKILGGTGQNCKGEVTLSSLKISDNCSKDIQVILSSGEGVAKHHLGEKLMLSSGTHSVIVQALDECHNSSLDTVIVVVKDETAPSAICLREMVVSVNDQGRALIDAKEMDQGSFDNCGPLVSQCGARMSDLMQFDSLLEKNRNFRIEHVDYLAISLIRGGCGRTFESTSNIIIVKDKNTGNARDTVLNTIDGLGYSLSAVNLDTTKVIQRKDLCTSEVLFCCEDMNSGLQVAYTVTDKSGNKNTCMVNVEVQEKSSPSIHCPPDVTVHCTYPLSANYSVFGKVAFEGKQEKLQISPSEVVSHSKALVDGVAFGRCLDSVRESVNESLNSCAVGTVERTFTVRSMNGRESSCKQRITIISDPSATKPEVTYPRDTTIEGCIDTSAISVVLLGTPRAAEGRCNQIGFAHKDEYINLNNGSGAGCWKVIRRWSVYENCTGKTGLVGTKDQVIIFTNSVAPQIAETMDTMRHNIIGSCDAQPITFKNRATDDCTPATELDWKLEITQVSGGTFSRTVTPSVGADTVATTTLSLGGGTYNLRWIVSDGCGNTDVEDQKAIVTVTSNLSAICLGEVTVVLDENRRATVDASVADIGSTNYSCDENVNVVYSFDSTKVISTRRFDCEDLGSMEIKMFVLALDATGLIIESVPCTVRFMTEAHANASCPSGIQTGLPDGETASILGLVLSRNTAAMSKVQMKLTDNESIINNSTNGIGEYGFENIVMGGQYELKPYKNDDWLNGVSTLDLLMIQKHILGLERFRDAYDLIASDINNDEIISAIDMIALRRLILGVDDEVKSNTSWRFVWAGEDLSSFELGNPLTDKYKIWPLESDMLIDWTGIKIGDVSGNVVTSAQTTYSRANRSKSLVYTVAGENRDILAFSVENSSDIEGLQGEIQLNGLGLSSIYNGQLKIGSESVHIDKEGNLAFSIALTNKQNVNSNQPLFSLKLSKSIDSETAQNQVSLNNRKLNSEWYANQLIFGMDLKFEESVQNQILLGQNSPNPWKDVTFINFEVPKEGKVLFNIFSSVGKLVHSKEINAQRGENSIKIDKKDVPDIGMYIYEIEYGQSILAKKMFRIE